MNANPAASIVLVHGAFADGSGWRAVYDMLTQDGYKVDVVQNPTPSLQGDGGDAGDSTPRTARWCWSATPTAAP